MDIFLLRHAETPSNLAGDLTSNCNEPLSKKGLEQSQLIVDELMSLNIKSVLCSPYPRAIQTVSPFIEKSGLPIKIEGCLAEGQLVLESNIKGGLPSYVKGKNYPVEGETKQQFIGRAKQAAELILQQSHDTILVVSHGHLLRELLNIFLATNKKIRFPHSNCGLSFLSWNEQMIVNYLNRELAS